MTRLLAFACCMLIFVSWASEAGVRGLKRSEPADSTVPGVVIVKFKPGVTPVAGALGKGSGALGGMLAHHGVMALTRTFPAARPPEVGLSAGSRMDLSRIYYATVKKESDVRVIAGRLSRLPQVEYAEPKYFQHLRESPNDALFSSNQAVYFSRLEALSGWGFAKGSQNVTIAVVDGGTYWEHEDLVGNLWVNAAEDLNNNGRFEKGAAPVGDEDGVDQDGDGRIDDVAGWNFTNNTNDARGLSTTPQSRAHGTATASHFGAVTNNTVGMAGSSWNCRMMPVCVASATADSRIEYGYEGIHYAFTHGAQIVNCSWGRLGVYSQFERDVVIAASEAGTLVVSAAGNDSVNVDLVPEYPSSFPEVFGIGATNSTSDAKAWFSNYGVNISVFAPGTNIWSALDGGGYGNGGSGTSYSSPLVAGLAGILKSANTAWTPDQIRAQIRTTSDSIDLSNPTYAGSVGRGRANFARALTESHAGIQILAASVTTPSGRDFFIPGDTAVVTLIVKNILLKDAANLQFTISSTDAAFLPLTGPVSIASLPQNAQASLPPMMMTVGAVANNRAASIAVRWVSNGNERDALAYRVYLFTSIPHWFLQPTPAAAALYSVRAVSPSVAWAAGGNGTASAPVVVRTTDGGVNWTDVTGGLSGMDLYCIFAIDDMHAWVGSGDGRIFATTDAGTNWSHQPYPGTQSAFIDGIWFFDANNGYALGDPAGAGNKYIVLTTTNGGASWAHLPAEPVAATGEAGWNNSFWWTDSQHGWFGTNQFKIRGTSDGGATWFSGPTSFQSSLGVSFKDNLNGVAVFDDGHAQVTVKGGTSWAFQSNPAPGGQLLGVSFAPGTDAVWATDGQLPYRSRDAGRTWSVESTFPFTGSLLHVSFVDSSHGWGSTSFGEVLRYKTDTAQEIPPPTTSPMVFALEQNYPNPFNASTWIRFSLPAASHVKVAVYDLLGREVRVLYDGDRPAGPWNVQFSGEGIASGVYLYRIKTKEFEATRKMLLIR